MSLAEVPNDTSGRLWTGTRWVFVFVAAAALVLGFLGLRDFLAGPLGIRFGRSWLDILYYDLQLFVLDSAPLGEGGKIPVTLQIARFLAPAVTLFAVVEAARVLFAGEWSRWRRRRISGHTIVVGETALADALVDRLRAGTRVERISTGDAAALRAAGGAGAAVVHACVDDARAGAPNIEALMAAAHPGSGRSRPLRAYAWVSDPVLGRALAARRLGHAAPEGVRLDLFIADELAARELIRDEQLGSPITIIGLGAFGQAVLVEYARRWRLLGAGRLPVTLVDDAATRTAADLMATWDVVRKNCDVVAVDGPPPSPAPSQHRVYVCYDDEQRAYSTALTMVRLWRGGPQSLVVRLDRLKHHGEAFGRSTGHLLDDLGGRIRMIDATALACDPMVLDEDLTERLARAIHADYLASQVAKGTPMGSNASMVPWEDLTPDMKQANRGPAGDIGRKLEAIGATVAPRTGPAEPFGFLPGEVERLAEMEHERWVTERTEAGWRHATARDNAARQHPSLVPWAQLSEAEREKDREAVRSLPSVLAEVALQLVRL